MLRYGIPSVFLALTIIAVSPAPAAPAPAPHGGAEDALRALDDKFVEDFNKKDVNALLTYYAADAVVMDPGPQMWIKGHDAIRLSFSAMLAEMDLVQFKTHDASYHVVGNVGWSAGLWTMTVKDAKTHATQEMAGRFSAVFEKRGEKWVCVVDHASVPTGPPPATSGGAK